ncbi:MAG: hypothetical protein ACREBV_02680 [Candidatus Zixiibacteriota bacterium]
MHDFCNTFLSQTDFGETIAAAVGALLGGLLGFASAIYFHVLVKRQERWIKHYNALIGLQHQLNEQIESITVDTQLFKDFAQSVKDFSVDSIGLFWSIPRLLEIDKSTILDLGNLTLINNLFGLDQEFRRMNDDITAMMSNYEKTKDAFISKTISPNQMIRTSNEVADRFRLLIRGLAYLDNKVCEILAAVRIHTRKDEPLSMIRYFRKRKSNDVSKEEISDELEELKSEIETVRAESRKRIDFLFGESGTV